MTFNLYLDHSTTLSYPPRFYKLRSNIKYQPYSRMYKFKSSLNRIQLLFYAHLPQNILLNLRSMLHAVNRFQIRQRNFM